MIPALLMLAWGLLCGVYGALGFAHATTMPEWFEASMAIMIATISLGFAFVLDALRKRKGIE